MLLVWRGALHSHQCRPGTPGGRASGHGPCRHLSARRARTCRRLTPGAGACGAKWLRPATDARASTAFILRRPARPASMTRSLRGYRTAAGVRRVPRVTAVRSSVARRRRSFTQRSLSRAYADIQALWVPTAAVDSCSGLFLASVLYTH